jgi:hypothetical protein
MKGKKMFDGAYYDSRKNKIQNRQRDNVQRLINAAFEFVSLQGDLQEQFNELVIREKESQEQEKKTEKKK